MAQIAISITKRAIFRDSTQEFSNVYHYGALGPNPIESEALNLIDEVVATEKGFHSTAVTFLLGRCWSSGGTVAQNQMIAEKTLTGTGSSALLTAMDYERAVLIQWPAGLDSRGRPVYLRKWYHSCGNFGSVGFSNSILQNVTGLSAAQRSTIVGLVDVLSRIGPTENYGLVAESGRERSGTETAAVPPTCHPYLEHHQLGDQWR